MLQISQMKSKNGKIYDFIQMMFQKYWVILNFDFFDEFSLDYHQINLMCLYFMNWGLERENEKMVCSLDFFFSDILAKIDPKNEEEEKRRIEARREKQRRRREKNSEKYGDGYRFV